MTDSKLIRKPKTLRQAVNLGASLLKKKNISNARNEVLWFLEHYLEINKKQFLDILKEPLSNDSYEGLNYFLKMRAKQIPFQYILKKTSFYGRDFRVENCALIPRPESEIIIEILKKSKKKGRKLLDIGTGTGCLGITSHLEKLADVIHLIDINSNILNLVQKNCRLHNVKKARFIMTDILLSTPTTKYDIILSNPPYISNSEFKLLDESVRIYEPTKSLTDFEDGYKFYKRYAAIFKSIMNKKAIAILELSHLFDLKKIRNIFKDFSNIKFHKDLNGDIRVVSLIND